MKQNSCRLLISLGISIMIIAGCNLFQAEQSCNELTDISERYEWEGLQQFTHKSQIKFNDHRSTEEIEEYVGNLGLDPIDAIGPRVVVEIPCEIDPKQEVFTRHWNEGTKHATLGDSSFVEFANPIFKTKEGSLIGPTNVVMVTFQTDLEKTVIDSIAKANKLKFSDSNPGSDRNHYNFILQIDAREDPVNMGQYLDSLEETRAAQASFTR